MGRLQDICGTLNQMVKQGLFKESLVPLVKLIKVPHTHTHTTIYIAFFDPPEKMMQLLKKETIFLLLFLKFSQR